jgi:transposase
VVGFSWSEDIRSFFYHVHDLGTTYNARTSERRHPTTLGPEWNGVLEAYWQRLFATAQLRNNVGDLQQKHDLAIFAAAEREADARKQMESVYKADGDRAPCQEVIVTTTALVWDE